MKIDAYEDSPYYWRRYFSGRLVVRLNGIDTAGVVEADDTEGYLVRMIRDSTGKVVTFEDGNIKQERLAGKVEFFGEPIPGSERHIARLAAAEAKRQRRSTRNLRVAQR